MAGCVGHGLTIRNFLLLIIRSIFLSYTGKKMSPRRGFTSFLRMPSSTKIPPLQSSALTGFIALLLSK
jgi:hypothetical protein